MVRKFCLFTIWVSLLPLCSVAQGDWAVYETFSRYSPAVYSIRVEIPEDYIMDFYEEKLRRLREYQESYSDLVVNSTDVQINYSVFENYIIQWEQQLNSLKNQMLKNNQGVRGAGFAVSPHHLVTLSTVIKSATLGGEINLMNETQLPYKAKVVGTDEHAGIAVLKVKNATFTNYVDINRAVKPLPEASYIMAIQRPYDLPASPFSGMIGGYHRRTHRFELERYIQTDVPLYPGNEGAPVFSPTGQLIGMIASEYHVSRWPGVTFLIPADIIIDSAKAIIEDGERERGHIPGMSLKQFGRGVVIDEVVPDSLAEKSGFKEGDQVLRFDDQDVNNIWHFHDAVLDSNPHENVKIDVIRDGKFVQLSVQPIQR